MIVHTKSQVLELLRTHRDDVARHGVKRCGVFGSFVRDEADANSDVDILVEFDPVRKTFDNYSHLANYLEDLFGRSVDLVTPESLSPYIGPRIMQEVEYAVVGA